MVNPYEFDDDIDRDLFEESSAPSGKHTLDGSVCPTCNVIHQAPEGLSQGAVDHMLRFIDKLPDELAKSILSSGRIKPPRYAEMVTMILDYTTTLDNTNDLGPLLRSIVEHLDEKTDGKITKRWRIYEVERRLLATHYALKAINNSLQEARAKEDTPEEFVTLLGLMEQFMCDRVEYLKDAYITETEGQDYKPVEEVINTGTYPEELREQIKYLMLDDMLSELDD